MTQARDIHNHDEVFKMIMEQARQYSQELSTDKIRITLKTTRNSYEVGSQFQEGLNQEARKLGLEVDSYIKDAYANLSSFSYYRFDPINQKLVMNYDDIVNDFSDIIRGADRFFASRDNGKRLSSRIDDRLFFLQSIHYDDLLNEDFELFTPMRMLAEGKGDCESKQIFLAGLLNRMLPGRKVYLVVLPDKEHIVTALEMPDAPHELTYKYEGKPYLILDATGPSHLKVFDTLTLRKNMNFDYGRKLWIPIQMGSSN